MVIPRYRKLIAGVVGVIAFMGNQLWGWEADEAMIEQIINGVIGVLMLVGIERSRNEPGSSPLGRQGGAFQERR